MSSAAIPTHSFSAPAPHVPKAAPGTCNRSIYDLRGNPYNWNIRDKFIPLSDCEVPSVQLNATYKFRSFLEYHSNVGAVAPAGGAGALAPIGETLEYILIADENENWNNIVSLRIARSDGSMTLNAVGNDQIQQLIDITYNKSIKNINDLFTSLASAAVEAAAGYWDVRTAFNDALKEFFTAYFKVNKIENINIKRKAIRLFLADLKRNGDMVQIEILSRFQSEHPAKTFIFVTHDYRAALIANNNYKLNVVYEDTKQYLCLKPNNYIKDNSENELTDFAEEFFDDLSEDTIVVGWDDRNPNYTNNRLDFIKDSVHDRFRGKGLGMHQYWDSNAFINYFNTFDNRATIDYSVDKTKLIELGIELGTILNYFDPKVNKYVVVPPYNIYMEADGTGRLLTIQKMKQKYLGRIKFGQGNFDGATIGAEPRGDDDSFYDKGEEDVCVIPDSILDIELAVRRTALIINRKNHKRENLGARFNAAAHAPAAANGNGIHSHSRSGRPLKRHTCQCHGSGGSSDICPYCLGYRGSPNSRKTLRRQNLKTRKNSKKLRKTRRRR